MHFPKMVLSASNMHCSPLKCNVLTSFHELHDTTNQYYQSDTVVILKTENIQFSKINMDDLLRIYLCWVFF